MNEPHALTFQPVRLTRYLWIAAGVWTLLIAASLAWNVFCARHETLEIAKGEARGAVERDFVYRRWATSQGGVYVLSSKSTPPNPYLAQIPERDITTPSGRKLTLLNPAYMTRLVYGAVKAEKGEIRGHITSLKPLRPANAPDAWEAKALEAFDCGETVVSSTEQIDGRPYLRLMRPAVTEQGCLKCHADQGYQVGDIRGGISVSVPLEPLLAAARVKMLALTLVLGAVWVVGLGGVWLGLRGLRRREEVERSLRASEQEYRTLFEASPDAVALFDGERFVECNSEALRMFGCESRDEFLGRHPADFSPPTQPGGGDSRSLAAERIGAAWNWGSGQFQWTYRRLDGTPFDTEVSFNALDWRGGKVLEMVVRDVTERKRIEEKMQATVGELERFNRLAVGREQKMLQLKREVNALLGSLGRDDKYEVSAMESTGEPR
ncbi:MAG: c-type heme family protein [Pirellulales bacterium]